MYLGDIKEGMKIELYSKFKWNRKTSWIFQGEAIVSKIINKYKCKIIIKSKIKSEYDKEFEISSFDIIDENVYENNKEISNYVSMDNRIFSNNKTNERINNNILKAKADYLINWDFTEEDEYTYNIHLKDYGLILPISKFKLDFDETHGSNKKFEDYITIICCFISLCENNKIVLDGNSYITKCFDCKENVTIVDKNTKYDNDDIFEKIDNVISEYASNGDEVYQCEKCIREWKRKEKIKEMECESKGIIKDNYIDYNKFFEENGLKVLDESYTFKKEKTNYRRIYCKCGERLFSTSDNTKVESHILKMINKNIIGCEKCEKDKIDYFIKEHDLILEYTEKGDCKIKCSCGKLIKKVVKHNAYYNIYNMMLDNIIGCSKCMEQLHEVKENKTINIRLRKPTNIRLNNNKLIQNYVAKEGRKKILNMVIRNRSSYLVKLAKDNFRRKHGKLYCECCGFDFNKFGLDYAEAHHKYALKEREDDEDTRIEDLAIICSNCHSLLHGLNVTLEELKNKLKGE